MSKKPFPFSVCEECCSGDGGSIILDKEMSETSENAVQNKVIKKYVDDNMEKIETKAGAFFSNALKGNVSGEQITLTDVSPIEHELNVKVTSESIVDFSDVSVLTQGKNIFNYNLLLEKGGVLQEDGSIYFEDARAPRELKVFEANGYTGQVTLSYKYKTKNATGSGGTRFLVVYTDASTQYIGQASTLEYTNVSATSFANKTIDYIKVDYGSSTNSTWLMDIMLEYGNEKTTYEPYVEPIKYPAFENGTVQGVKSIYPTMIISSDTENVQIEAEYNKDINKAFEKIAQAIISLGGNV